MIDNELYLVLIGMACIVGLFIYMHRTTKAQSAEYMRDAIRQLVDARKEISERLERQSQDLATTIQGGIAKNTETAVKTIGSLREDLGKIIDAKDHITTLSQNITSLQGVLSNRQARGAFGEIQLEDIVKTALAPSQFRFQASLGRSDRGGTQKVDCLILLPDAPGPLPVDSKFPLEGYRALCDAPDDAAAAAARKRLTGDVSKHLGDIASKYIIPGETADLALMFLPSEAVYAEIHASLPEVVEQSQKLRVYMVSPTTMMAVLTTVRAIFRDVEMQKRTREVIRRLGLIAKDVERLDQRADKLERHFKQANGDVLQVRTSANKIVSGVERIQALDSKDPAIDVMPSGLGIESRSETSPQQGG